MASDATYTGEDSAPPVGAALQHGHWPTRNRLSSGLAALERFLGAAGFDRAPWLAVGFAAGIALWFELANAWQWLALIGACLGLALVAAAAMRADGRFPFLRLALLVLPGAVALGCLTVWAKSAMVGTPGIARPMVGELTGEILGREDQPAEERVRFLLATREPATARPIVVRVNVPLKAATPEMAEGATLRLRARLMPPSPPMLPGGYDFARTAWFAGIAATGSALGDPVLVAPGAGGGGLAKLQRSLSEHVHSRLAGSPGGIASAFASGDRGGIAEADEDAMRDAGLTHLLSVSGLHVSAVIAVVYFVAIRLLALWPWLALRVRLPILAAGAAAAAGIGYTLLTGAEVPTVRSCIGALLVLLALALGREPLSLRMLAVAAICVMLLWPEAVVGPSFQMSFGAVIAIVALAGSDPVRRFLAPRDEAWWVRGARQFAMLLFTGVVIELALLPIGLFHFHKTGVYGAFANVVAIPLTTFVTMPLIGIALLLDTVGAGLPAWWLCGKSLDLLLAIAHWTASRPGAVTRLPAIGDGAFALFLIGALWLALWRGRARLLGVVPAGIAAGALALLHPPDLLISGDGHHVGIVEGGGDRLLLLRESRESFASETLTELAGMSGEITSLAEWPGARCSPDFCTVELVRGRRTWHLLIGRSKDAVTERQLAAACDLSDIVIADRWLPRSCQPKWLKADRNLLDRTGGLAIDLEKGSVATVAQGQGEHGWWREKTPQSRPAKLPVRPSAAKGSVGSVTSHPAPHNDGPQPPPAAGGRETGLQ
ncbi:MAG: ComEC/Rec2 family competence protein [Novosphingobium sp.]